MAGTNIKVRRRISVPASRHHSATGKIGIAAVFSVAAIAMAAALAPPAGFSWVIYVAAPVFAVCTGLLADNAGSPYPVRRWRRAAVSFVGAQLALAGLLTVSF